jgi:hypothetical protein
VIEAFEVSPRPPRVSSRLPPLTTIPRCSQQAPHHSPHMCDVMRTRAQQQVHRLSSRTRCDRWLTAILSCPPCIGLSSRADRCTAPRRLPGVEGLSPHACGRDHSQNTCTHNTNGVPHSRGRDLLQRLEAECHQGLSSRARAGSLYELHFACGGVGLSSRARAGYPLGTSRSHELRRLLTRADALPLHHPCRLTSSVCVSPETIASSTRELRSTSARKGWATAVRWIAG